MVLKAGICRDSGKSVDPRPTLQCCQIECFLQRQQAGFLLGRIINDDSTTGCLGELKRRGTGRMRPEDKKDQRKNKQQWQLYNIKPAALIQPFIKFEYHHTLLSGLAVQRTPIAVWPISRMTVPY